MLLSAGREKSLIKLNCNGVGAAWDLTCYKFIPRLIENTLSVVSRLIIRKGGERHEGNLFALSAVLTFFTLMST